MEKSKEKTKLCKKVITKDHECRENGWLLEIGSMHDNFTEHLPGQVYLSVCKPKMVKGFHLHKKKTNQYTCVKGNVKLVVWDGKKYNEYEMGEKNFLTVKVKPGEPAAFYNPNDEDAYIINCCFPAWFPGDNEQEEWVSDYKFNH